MTEPLSSNGGSSSTELEYFFQNSLCGFIITDTSTAITRVNERLIAWTGSEAKDLLGKQFTSLLSIGGRIYYETHLGPLLRMQGFFDEVVLELVNVDGSKRKVLVNAKECFDKDQVRSIHFTILKASDRLQYEQNLQLEKKIAERELDLHKDMVALREQLIAVLGHDLRNPLAASSMAIHLLEQSPVNNDAAQIIATLKRSSNRMTELVAHIMDFARTKMGEGLPLNLQSVMLEPVIRQVVMELKLIFPLREIVSTADIVEPVYCDPDRISQLVSNLVANALTHGAVDMPVVVHAAYNNDSFELSVTNNGSPIPPGLHEKLFSPFTREGNRPSQQGLGLGLYICAEIAKAHKGELDFVSTEEETRFTFRIPRG